jgi:colanic acid biosynthesis glycosyl transferase WcaI
MKSVLIVCQNYMPGAAATDDVIRDLAEGLRDAGMKVTVLCRTASQQPEPSDADSSLRIVAAVNPVLRRILRMTRLVDPARIARHLLKNRSAYDVIITTDQPFGARLTVAGVNKILGHRTKQIAWAMDFSPGRRNLIQSSRARRSLCKAADWITVQGLRSADRTVAIGQDMAALLASVGVQQFRIKFIGIWPNVPGLSQPQAPVTDEALPFSILYSGHLGPWHDYKTISAAIPSFSGDRVLFRFAGVGRGIDRLKQVAASGGMKNIVFEERVGSVGIVTLLSSADAHLVTLHDSALGTCVPSKLYAAMAVAMPVIFVGPSASQASMDVRASGVGFVVAPGDVRGLEQAIRKLAADRREARRLGVQGHQWFRKHRSREVAIGAWAQLLSETAPSPHQTAPALAVQSQ